MLSWKRKRLDGMVHLYRLFAERTDDPWFMRSHFEARREVAVLRTRLTVCCAVHVMPVGQSGSPFKSSITIWPKGKTLPSAQRGRWNASLRDSGWYDACARSLRQRGYRGRWRPSPWGRFGDFWKDLKGTEALLAEVQALEQVRAADWASLVGPSNKAMQLTKRTEAGGARIRARKFILGALRS